MHRPGVGRKQGAALPFFQILGESGMANLAGNELLKASAIIKENIRRYGAVFTEQSRPGYRSGLEYYPADWLIVVVRNAMSAYRKKFGRYPNLLEPTTFNEKIIWSKFFGHKKIPESGNKLSTGSFLPDSVKADVLVPEVVWRSYRARIPVEDIAPGSYYLKVSHGSGMVRRVDFPMGADELTELQILFSRFLLTDYGRRDGEWWYSTFRREVFLEKSVSSDEYPIAWCFHVFAGKVKLVIPYQKAKGGHRASWLDERCHLLEEQNPAIEPVELPDVPQEILDRMSAAAALIGNPFPYVRVDFLIGDNGSIYLSELTHSPGNGLAGWPDHMDRWLGRDWDLGI